MGSGGRDFDVTGLVVNRRFTGTIFCLGEPITRFLCGGFKGSLLRTGDKNFMLFDTTTLMSTGWETCFSFRLFGENISFFKLLELVSFVRLVGEGFLARGEYRN